MFEHRERSILQRSVSAPLSSSLYSRAPDVSLQVKTHGWKSFSFWLGKSSTSEWVGSNPVTPIPLLNFLVVRGLHGTKPADVPPPPWAHSSCLSAQLCDTGLSADTSRSFLCCPVTRCSVPLHVSVSFTSTISFVLVWSYRSGLPAGQVSAHGNLPGNFKNPTARLHHIPFTSHIGSQPQLYIGVPWEVLRTTENLVSPPEKIM